METHHEPTKDWVQVKNIKDLSEDNLKRHKQGLTDVYSNRYF